jgi:hypothetical protein
VAIVANTQFGAEFPAAGQMSGLEPIQTRQAKGLRTIASSAATSFSVWYPSCTV